MSFKCKIGIHSWDGCKCTECGKTHDEQHDWSIDCEQCSKCNKTRENKHDWTKDCEKCEKCGKSREDQHDWTEDCEKCSKCEKLRDIQHDWAIDCEKCTKCKKTRKDIHKWLDCTCIKCGKREHEWSNHSKPFLRCGKMIEISTIYELQDINKDLAGHYCLIRDIDASATKNWNGGKGFLPIGFSGNLFKGTLEGNNHSIDNLFINREEENFVGIFRSVYGGVNNLMLSNIRIIGNDNVGGIAGTCEGPISNCKVSGEIEGNNFVGGLFGNFFQTHVIKCKVSTKIRGKSFIGGLAGLSSKDSEVSGCEILSNVSGLTNIGGVVGVIDNNSKISFCTNSGKVSGTKFVGGLSGLIQKKSEISFSDIFCEVSGQEEIGGIAGNIYQSSSISKSISKSKVSGQINVGGLVGDIIQDSTISQCIAYGEVSGKLLRNSKIFDTGKGLVGSNFDKCIVTESYWDINETKQPTSDGGEGKTTQEMMKRETFIGWDFDETWQIEEGKSYPKLRCFNNTHGKENLSR